MIMTSRDRSCGEYLATGFTDVDGRNDQGAYTRCLTMLDALPYFQTYKHRSFDLLDLTPGLSVLEIGSGLGDDCFRMAERVGPSGHVLGVDASIRMVEEARGRTPAGACVEFRQADARALPFPADSFARCRADRTLQHIEDPEQAIGEMVRVLEPGGRLLVYDNDWGTFSVTGRNDETTRVIETLWEDSITNRWIGRYLKQYFLEAGLCEVQLEPSVSVMTDFALADRAYNLLQTVERAVAAGWLTPVIAEHWVQEALALSRAGAFLCNLTAYTVYGMKPVR